MNREVDDELRDASCEMAIGVIKNKIGLPQALKGAYFISLLEIFPPLSSWAESKEGRKIKISEFFRCEIAEVWSRGVVKSAAYLTLE